MRNLFLKTVLLSGVVFAANAQDQNPGNQIQEKFLNSDGNPFLIKYKEGVSSPSSLKYVSFLKDNLGLSVDDDLRYVKSSRDANGGTHEKYQQYYKNVKVEGSIYIIHNRGGNLESLSGRVSHIKQASTLPKINSIDALKAAVDFVGATTYMWQIPVEENALKESTGNKNATYLPIGELLFLDLGKSNFSLAWKFEIYAQKPFSRDYIYVDAGTGKVVMQDPISKSIAAPFDTRYSNRRNVETEANPGGGFRLRDATRGNGIQTFNSRNSATIGGASDFLDNDNNWTSAEYNNSAYDNVAGDAHLGAEVTYDYWLNTHNRRGFDDRNTTLRSYVHFNDGDPDNAGWTGAEMVYGDGGNNFKPTATIDVAGHEIGHGVCQSTAALIYQSESGALNEGFSDIWGACIEYYAGITLGRPGSTWLIGEDITKRGGGLRSMSDPRSLNQPAYRGGQYWVPDPGAGNYSRANDFGGVHTNSGVANHWFYVLANGENATNEGGYTYSISGIGINSAARIVYLAESQYMTPTHNYDAARALTIQAAQVLFGNCSAEVIATTNAWAAVGVGQPIPAAVISGPSQLCTTASTFTANSVNVMWTASPSSYFTNASGSGNQFTTAAAAGARGTGTITATLPGCSTPTNFTVQIGEAISGTYTVQATGTGGQLVPEIYGSNYVDGNYVNIQFPYQYNTGTTYTFSLDPSPHSIYQYGPGGVSLTFRTGSAGSYSALLNVTKSSPCGTVTEQYGFGYYYYPNYNYSVSPNPSDSELAIEKTDTNTSSKNQSLSSNNSSQPFSIFLYDAYGKLIRSKDSNLSKALLNVSDVPSGLYNLRVIEGDKVTSKHIEIKH